MGTFAVDALRTLLQWYFGSQFKSVGVDGFSMDYLLNCYSYPAVPQNQKGTN